MGLDKFVVSTIVFLVMIFAGTLIIADMNLNYDDVDIDVEQYAGNITTIAGSDQLYNNSKDSQGKVLGGQVDDTDTADSMFTGGFSAIRLVTTPLSITNQVIQSVGNALGINPIFLKYAFSALVFLITFWIIFLIFRVRA